MNNKTADELPLGFGMALAMNPDAMKAFSSLPELGQKQYLERARAVKSKNEMEALVQSLASYGRGHSGMIG
ncbi:MAG TPA: YdeI/OmpD-associated family protein [Clostridiales bacterium]|jgi:copper homeostasis protein CutC|nr:YdeI/OmpD-associated family protein [Clostridiales bacterium]